MKEFDLWDLENEIVKKAYQGENYQVWNRPVEGKKCLILFSGNGLFYPNTENSFKECIFEKDRYEYQSLAKSKNLQCFSRIIFVRDIYKQWYVNGMNATCPDVEKTAAVLREKTEGYQITTAGNSAGGYAAVLFGILLSAKRIYSFSGQFDITDKKGNKFIDLYEQDETRNCFYDLRPLLRKMDVDTKYITFVRMRMRVIEFSMNW